MPSFTEWPLRLEVSFGKIDSGGSGSWNHCRGASLSKQTGAQLAWD